MPQNEDGLPGLQEAFVPPTIHLHLILDVSPSMHSRWSQTISGLNEYLDSLREDQKANAQPYKVTMTTFSAEIEAPYKEVELDSLPTFTETNLRPHGYGTALYDAVGPTVEKITTAEPVLVVIITDGEENSSRKWDSERLSKLMDVRQAAGNYTYAYLGVAKEAWGNAARMGSGLMKSANNVATEDYDKSLYAGGSRSLASMTCSYSATMRSNSVRPGAALNVPQFFDQPEAAEGTDVLVTGATVEGK